jgi:hypothetical protein
MINCILSVQGKNKNRFRSKKKVAKSLLAPAFQTAGAINKNGEAFSEKFLKLNFELSKLKNETNCHISGVI